jgi:hypothetical protein
MSAFTDMLLPDRGSEEREKTEQNDEGDPLPGTARHREFYPEGVAEILRVSSLLPHSFICLHKQRNCSGWFPNINCKVLSQSHFDGLFAMTGRMDFVWKKWLPELPVY